MILETTGGIAFGQGLSFSHGQLPIRSGQDDVFPKDSLLFDHWRQQKQLAADLPIGGVSQVILASQTTRKKRLPGNPP